jgi:hypothetical protein
MVRPWRRGSTPGATPSATPSATPGATPERALEDQPDTAKEQAHIPEHYFLSPANPSPFEGTLDASLDAILEFGRYYPDAMAVMDVLRAPVSTSTDWKIILGTALRLDEASLLPTARLLLEDIFFLVTRKLFPEQIAQNRKLMAQLYETKKSQSMRTSLRYDMLLEWFKRNNNHFFIVESRPLPVLRNPLLAPTGYAQQYPGRYPRMENVWASLIAGPPEGWRSHKKAETMKHHITGLDELLLFTDSEVQGWSSIKLFQKTLQVLLLWQWLRKNTEKMEDMDVDSWKELEGRAEESEWVREGK